MIIDAMDLLYTGRFSSFCLVTSDSDFTRLASRIREQGISVYGFGNKHNTHRAFIAACNKFVYLDALPVPVDEKEEEEAAAATAAAVMASNSTTVTTPAPPTPTPAVPTLQATPSRPVFGTASSSFPEPLAHRPLSPRKPTTTSTANINTNQPPPPTSTTTPRPTPLDRAAIKAIRKAITNSNPYDDDLVNLAEVGNYLTKLSPDLNPRNYGYTRLREFALASGIVEVKMMERKSGNGPPLALVRLKE